MERAWRQTWHAGKAQDPEVMLMMTVKRRGRGRSSWRRAGGGGGGGSAWLPPLYSPSLGSAPLRGHPECTLSSLLAFQALTWLVPTALLLPVALRC